MSLEQTFCGTHWPVSEPKLNIVEHSQSENLLFFTGGHLTSGVIPMTTAGSSEHFMISSLLRKEF